MTQPDQLHLGRKTGCDQGAEQYTYDGHRVRVNRGRGTHLFADVEVQIPRGERTARFRNLVGQIEAQNLRGHLRFEVASADLRLGRLEGALELDGSSGDIRAHDIRGIASYSRSRARSSFASAGIK